MPLTGERRSELLDAIGERVQRFGATRVVIDSISGFEAALAPAFREDFRESFYRLLVSLTALGVTVLSIDGSHGEQRLPALLAV